MSFRHLINIEDVTVDWWNDLYSTCKEIIAHPDDFRDACHGKVMASLFFEPSTRTNFSFQTAMMRLGGSVFGFSDPKATSSSKGETLADTIRMVSCYADTVVMRNPKEGAAKAASLYSEVPVINAGDGGHMHPTQTLADLTTINTLRGEIGNMNVGLCGDLKYGRTVHSLVMALSKFPNVTYYLIAPKDLAMPEYMLKYMRSHGQQYYEVTDLEGTIPELDVLYMTRIQQERFPSPAEYERLKGVYVLDRAKLINAKKDLLIMHPLPRVDEISIDVDPDPRAVYFEQARFGMYARMALLLKTTHMPHEKPPFVVPAERHICPNRVCVTRTEKYLPEDVYSVGPNHYCGYCDTEF